MRKKLLATGAALVSLVSGPAWADGWPGFFRATATATPGPASQRAIAPAAWNGFLRGEVLAAAAVDAQARVLQGSADPAAALGVARDGGSKLAGKPKKAEPSQRATEQTELAAEVRQSAELASALAATGGSRPPGFLKFSAGYFDILQDDNTAVSFSAEYHAGRQFWWFDPFAGLMVTSEGSAYAYAGVALDIVIADRVAITPSAAIGAYHDGGGKDLGHWVEFRTGAELAYIFNNDHRLGLSFYHLSNAGLGSDNPGTEVLQVSYSMPLGAFARN